MIYGIVFELAQQLPHQALTGKPKIKAIPRPDGGGLQVVFDLCRQLDQLHGNS